MSSSQESRRKSHKTSRGSSRSSTPPEQDPSPGLSSASSVFVMEQPMPQQQTDRSSHRSSRSSGGSSESIRVKSSRSSGMSGRRSQSTYDDAEDPRVKSAVRRTISSTGGEASPRMRTASPRGTSSNGGSAYDLSAMHRSISITEQAEPPPPLQHQTSGGSLKSNGSSGNGEPVKRDKYRSLWGKAAATGSKVSLTKVIESQPSEPSAVSRSSRSSGGKWDTVLNPLLSKKSSRSSKLTRKTSNLVPSQDYQQQYQPTQQQVNINYMNAPDNSTIQCDCGEDSCPYCNLLLNMEMTDPTMLM